MVGWILLGLGFLPLFFLWAALHEVMHYLAASSVREVDRVHFKLYPHTDPVAGFRFASVSWYQRGPPLEGRAEAWVYLAPRVPDLVGALLFPLAALFPGWWAYIWALVWLGGLIDGAWGSIGYTPHSDLRRGAQGLGISPWWLRIAGWALFTSSAALGTTLMVLR